MSDRAALVLVRGAIDPIEAADAPRWRRRGSGSMRGLAVAEPSRPRRIWALGLAATCACLAALGVAFGTRNSSFSLELSAGCEELSACSRLEAEAERRLLDCWLVCRREVMDLQRARMLRYRAEERSLVRDHYEKRDAAERAEALATAKRQQGEREREDAARERASGLEHERRMELERLRQEHADRVTERERTRRLEYLRLLGPQGREQRLRRCHEKTAMCEPLIVDLVESTTDKAERRALAELHERLASGLEPRPAARRAPPSAGRPASQPDQAAERPPLEPAEPATASAAPTS